jgi:hypothetical protein
LNTLSLCSSFNMRNQVSHRCNTTGIITAYYILYFVSCIVLL